VRCGVPPCPNQTMTPLGVQEFVRTLLVEPSTTCILGTPHRTEGFLLRAIMSGLGEWRTPRAVFYVGPHEQAVEGALAALHRGPGVQVRATCSATPHFLCAVRDRVRAVAADPALGETYVFIDNAVFGKCRGGSSTQMGHLRDIVAGGRAGNTWVVMAADPWSCPASLALRDCFDFLVLGGYHRSLDWGALGRLHGTYFSMFPTTECFGLACLAAWRWGWCAECQVFKEDHSWCLPGHAVSLLAVNCGALARGVALDQCCFSVGDGAGAGAGKA